MRNKFGGNPAQNAVIPPSEYTDRITDLMVRSEEEVIICAFSTSVGLNTAIDSAPAKPPAAMR